MPKIAIKSDTTKLTELISKEVITQTIQKSIDKFCKDYYEKDNYIFELKTITEGLVIVEFYFDELEKIDEYYSWVKKQKPNRQYKVTEELRIPLDEDYTFQEHLETVFGDTENFLYNLYMQKQN